MRLLNASGEVELGKAAVANHLASDGLVRFEKGTVDELRALLAGWTTPEAHPHDHEPGLTVITPNQHSDSATNEAGFSRAPLLPHTDRSLEPAPPSVLATVMVSPSSVGGHALIADGAAVLESLRRYHPPSAIGSLRLRTPTGRDTPIITISAGLARIRFRDDALARPWANGNPAVLATLRHAVLAATRSLPLSVGDGYVLHNHRYLHGRSRFSGKRRLVRMLASVTGSDLAWLNQGFSIADT